MALRLRTSATRSTYSAGWDRLRPASTLMLMLLPGSSNVQLGPLLAKCPNPRTLSGDAGRPKGDAGRPKGDADRWVAHELHRDGLSGSRPGNLLQPLPRSSCSLLQLQSELRRRTSQLNSSSRASSHSGRRARTLAARTLGGRWPLPKRSVPV